jgi:hypothetical protein
VHKIKSHKTVEQIAKKHRLDVSFISNQLRMGIPIEYEHTRDKDLATDIALQHLEEIPDYYTRLKKMESSAKKQHKKFKDVKEEIDLLDEGRRDNKKSGDPGYSLRDWFKGGGWIQVSGKYKGKPCAKQPGQKTKPFCRDADDAAAMSTSEKKRRTAKKRKEDPNPNRKGKAKMVRENFLQEKKDACYHKVKSRYKVWPSAYASGALVKCRNVGSKNWGTKSEGVEMMRYCPKCKKNETRSECKYGPKFWDMYSLPSMLGKDYTPNTPHPGNFPESYDHEHSMARSELSTIVSAAKRLRKKMKGEGNIEAWVQSKITKAADYLDAAADYVDSGEHKVNESSSVDFKNLTIRGGKSPFKSPILPGERREIPKLQEPNLNIPGSENLLKQATKNKNKTVQVAHYEPEGEMIDEKCWPGYKKKGMKTMFGKRYPNCVKNEEYSNWRKELFEQKNYVMPQASKPGAYAGGDKTRSYRVGDTIPVSATKPRPKPNIDYKPNMNNNIRNAGEKYGKEAFKEDWQKINRKDKTDGLSQAAVNAYRRENPGSKLKTAVTEKNPKGKRAGRRKRFCNRMSGMRSKLTSAKTARDPNSDINKALRRWRCR